MASAALLIIGTEMLDPAKADANGPLARQALSELGIPMRSLVRVEDRLETIATAVRWAMETCEVVLTSGGIGPTGDDLTREAVAAALGRGICEDAPWREILEARLGERNRTLTELGRRQAHIIEGAQRLDNRVGLACGSYLDLGDRVLALLPGVPREFRAMLEEGVLPKVAGKFPPKSETRVLRATVAGLPEVQAEEVLKPWYARPGVGVSILPSYGILKITFTFNSPPARDLAALDAEARRELEAGLKGHLVSLEGDSLESVVGQLLLKRGWTLAAAESCTGGKVSAKIVSVPGASRYFLGSLCAYANGTKAELLGVPQATLDTNGAVSEETALAMARGARARFGASCAVATTGVAGPDGGTSKKPVGMVWMAVGTPEGERTFLLNFPGERAVVMELSANYALHLLWKCLQGVSG
jgi:nicotinamide-nucleotide amidase